MCIPIYLAPVFLVGKAAFMVRWTWHHQTPLSASVVLRLPLQCEPLVHNCTPARGIITTPPRRHLHKK
jgi:hypothetical protein